MSIYVGDAGDVDFPIDTGPIDGTTVATVRIGIRRPNRTVIFVGPIVPTDATTESILCTWTRAEDGSSFQQEGDAYIRAWLFDSEGALIDATEEALIQVKRRRVPTPTY